MALKQKKGNTIVGIVKVCAGSIIKVVYFLLIDIHSHILPDLDDGPSNISQFIEMANTAVNTGITDIFATPHHLNGIFENKKEKVIQRISYYNQLLRNENLPLILHPGQELRVHREFFNAMKNDEILTFGDKGKYLLLELPSSQVPGYAHDIVYELLLKGITPILAHPERNKRFQEEPNLIIEYIHEGALTQITAGSILGTFGSRVKSFSEKMLTHKMVHFIASDAHNISTRSFILQEAYELITKEFGNEVTQKFIENSELLLKGDKITSLAPLPIRKKILGIF